MSEGGTLFLHSDDPVDLSLEQSFLQVPASHAIDSREPSAVRLTPAEPGGDAEPNYFLLAEFDILNLVLTGRVALTLTEPGHWAMRPRVDIALRDNASLSVHGCMLNFALHVALHDHSLLVAENSVVESLHVAAEDHSLCFGLEVVGRARITCAPDATVGVSALEESTIDLDGHHENITVQRHPTPPATPVRAEQSSSASPAPVPRRRPGPSAQMRIPDDETAAAPTTVANRDASPGRDAHLCRICQSNSVETVNLPCGHLIFCVDCTRDYKKWGRHKCPLCSQEISEIKRVFYG